MCAFGVFELFPFWNGLARLPINVDLEFNLIFFRLSLHKIHFHFVHIKEWRWWRWWLWRLWWRVWWSVCSCYKEEQNCRLVPLNKNKNLMSRCCLGNFQTNNDPVILQHGAVARLSTVQKPIQIPFFSLPLLRACVCCDFVSLFSNSVRVTLHCCVLLLCVRISYDVNCLFTMFWFRYKKSK